jgi:hypothetical protein
MNYRGVDTPVDLAMTWGVESICLANEAMTGKRLAPRPLGGGAEVWELAPA